MVRGPRSRADVAGPPSPEKPLTAPVPATVVMIPVGGGGGAVIVQSHVAGLGSMFPAGSLAFTSKWWLPTVRLEYEMPEVQGASASASRLQRKVEPASLAVKVKVADVLFVDAGGPEVIVVSGGVVSDGGDDVIVQS